MIKLAGLLENLTGGSRVIIRQNWKSVLAWAHEAQAIPPPTLLPTFSWYYDEIRVSIVFRFHIQDHAAVHWRVAHCSVCQKSQFTSFV